MTAKSLLFSLPRKVSIAILTELICMPELSRLDVAVGIAAGRNLLLEIMKLEYFVAIGNRGSASEAYIDWLHNRQVKTQQINCKITNLTGDFTDKNYNLFSKLTFLEISLNSSALWIVSCCKQTVKEIRLYGKIFTTSIVVNALHECKALHSLHLDEFTTDDATDVGSIASLPLKRFSASCSIIVAHICILAKSTLTSLDLTKCSIPGHALIAKSCSKLERLVLAECRSLTSDFLVSYATHNPNLREVDVSWCEEVTDFAVKSLASSCHHLTSFTANYCDLLTDASVTSIANCCPLISTVSLASCSLVTDSSVMPLVSRCAGLTSVNLSYTQTADGSLWLLLNPPHSLTVLNLSYCDKLSPAILLLLSGSLSSRLLSLDLSGLPVTDSLLHELVLVCSCLQTVNLSHCDLVTDLSLVAIADNCSSLTSLTVRYNENVTDASLIALMKGVCRESLTSLKVMKCVALTESGLRGITKHFPSLQMLDISGISRMNDDALETLARHGKKLRTLLMTDCKNITDVGVLALSRGMLHLHTLDISRCEEVTDEALIFLSYQLPNLTCLSISGCVRVTDEAVAAIKSNCVHLKSLNLYGCCRVSYNYIYM